MLVCARLRHVASSQWGSKRYMNIDHLSEMEDESEAIYSPAADLDTWGDGDAPDQ